MKVRLKTLPDKLRGVAWPSSARTVRRAVKSVNERDPRRQLLPGFFGNRGTLAGPLAKSQRKVWATVGQYGPNPLGYTRPTMDGTMGCDPERGSQSPNPSPVRIEGCNSPS